MLLQILSEIIFKELLFGEKNEVTHYIFTVFSTFAAALHAGATDGRSYWFRIDDLNPAGQGVPSTAIRYKMFFHLKQIMVSLRYLQSEENTGVTVREVKAHSEPL